jgi:hypothetical protein
MLKKTRIAVIVFYVLLLVGLARYDERSGQKLARDMSRDLPDVVEPGNAWVAILGFGARQGVLPFVNGEERARKVMDALRSGKRIPGGLRALEAPSDAKPELLFRGKIPDFQAAKYGGILAYAAANRDEVNALIGDNEELVRRYESLRTYPRYTEPLDSGVLALAPAFKQVKQAGTLRLFQLAIKAVDGDVEGALAGVREDAEFWRMMARSSGLLLSKMVCFAIMRMHLRLSAELAACHVPTEKEAAIARDTLRPFDKGEVVLADSIRGEARFIRKAIELASGVSADSWGLEAFICKPNATGNRLCGDFEDYVRLAEMNPREFALEAKQDCPGHKARRGVGIPFLYNPVGEVVAANIQEDFRGFIPAYIRTGHNLEGFRRLCWLKVLSHAEDIPKERTQEFLDAHKADNGDPFTGASMIWDPKNNTIYFKDADGKALERLPL